MNQAPISSTQPCVIELVNTQIAAVSTANLAFTITAKNYSTMGIRPKPAAGDETLANMVTALILEHLPCQWSIVGEGA